MKKIYAVILLCTMLMSIVPSNIKIKASTTPTIVISEVLANAQNEDTDEFIELYNAGDEAVDLGGWKFTDGDSLDTLIQWDTVSLGEIENAQTQTTLLEPRQYAVILDSEYNNGTKPYSFEENSVVITCANTTLGNELTATDPITLFDPAMAMVSTFGTPIDDADPLKRDDDGLDGIPFDPGKNISIERIDLEAEDTEENWAKNVDESSTPSKENNPFINFSPEILDVYYSPENIIENSNTKIKITAEIEDPNGEDDIKQIELDLTSLGLEKELLEIVNGKVAFEFDLPSTIKQGSYKATIKAIDLNELEATEELQIIVGENIITYQSNIFINEILPNPEGSDADGEFIEIINLNTSEVDLAQWKLKDASGKIYEMEETVKARSMSALYQSTTKIVLNNSLEQISLIRPDGKILQEVSINEEAVEGSSYARDTKGKFFWTTTPTPNLPNVFESEEVDEEEIVEEKQETEQTENEEASLPETVSIAKAKTMNKGEEVCTTGTASVDPNIFSEKYIYLQDNEEGIMFYSSQNQLENLKIGHLVKACGKIGESYQEKKLNLDKDITIETLDKSSSVKVATIKTGSSDKSVGNLVISEGTITKQSGSTLYIDDGSGELKVSILKNTKIVKPKLKKGDKIKLAGIINRTSSGTRLLPRYQSDINPNGLVLGAIDIKKLPQSGANYDRIREKLLLFLIILSVSIFVTTSKNLDSNLKSPVLPKG